MKRANTKRVLATLLAVAVLCGVGAVGASAGGYIYFAPEDFGLRASYDFFSGLPGFFSQGNAAEELAAGLLPGKTADDFLADLRDAANDSSWSEITIGSLYWDALGEMEVGIYDPSLDPDAHNKLVRWFDAHDASIKAILTVYVNNNLIGKIEAYKDAYVDFIAAENELDWCRIKSKSEYEGFRDEYDAYNKIHWDKYQGPYWDGDLSLARVTIARQELTIELRAMIEKFSASPPASLFWDTWPPFLVSLLRYVLFGWLWMRWF